MGSVNQSPSQETGAGHSIGVQAPISMRCVGHYDDIIWRVQFGTMPINS